MHRATIKKITAITLGLVAAFGAMSAIVWSYSDAKGVWDFWSGPAASWVQAIGSIVAIMASFELGQRSFKNQMKREKIADLDRKRHAYMLLNEVFGYAGGVSAIASVQSNRPAHWKQVDAAAQDALRLIESVPMMDIPNAFLLQQLILCRNSMITYRGYSSTAQGSSHESPGARPEWSEYARESAQISKQASHVCNQEAHNLQKLIDELQQ